jgi:hypothetical protein
MGGMRKACKILDRKPQGKRSSLRIILKWILKKLSVMG